MRVFSVRHGNCGIQSKSGYPADHIVSLGRGVQAAHPTIANSAMTKDEKTRALEEEVAQLKRELVQATQECQKARACAHAWETMVDVAEKMYGIEIKKKVGAKQ